jgi:hypothetical protein
MTRSEIIIDVEPIVVVNRRSMRPLQDRTEYTCTGPDGRTYKNTNKAELLSLLHRRYGDFTATFRADHLTTIQP